MNIEMLVAHIDLFQNYIVGSGFKRDINDYVSSLPSNQNNIVALREVASKCKDHLQEIYNSDLPCALTQLLPNGKVKPFTETNHYDNIAILLDNKEIQVADFFNKLTNFLTQLNSQIQQNINEVDKLKTIFSPYITKEKELISKDNKAIISIIFKDKETITSLKHFSKTISVWNRTLPLYHQIISSSSPEDSEILEVQNGSIDFIFNINFDVAINLADLFKIGFKCYLGYLTYKSVIKTISATYFGNKKLLESEVEREKELLNNISLSIRKEIIEQHKKAKALDNSIDDNIDKKVDEVTKLITSHIIRGNDVKLLSLPEHNEEIARDNDNINDSKNDLAKVSLEVRRAMKVLPANDVKMLMEKYGKVDEE